MRGIELFHVIWGSVVSVIGAFLIIVAVGGFMEGAPGSKAALVGLAGALFLIMGVVRVALAIRRMRREI